MPNSIPEYVAAIRTAIYGEEVRGAIADSIEYFNASAVASGDIGPTFSTSSSYVIGDYVMHDGTLYRFKQAHSAGAWNANHVDEVKVTDVLEQFAKDIAPVFSENTDYSVGDYVMYGGYLYKFNYDHSAGAWNSGQVSRSNVSTILENYLSANSGMIANAAQLSAVTNGTRSCNDFPINKVITIGAYGIGFLNYPKILEENESNYHYEGMGLYFTMSHANNSSNATVAQIHISRNGLIATRFKFNSTTGWSEWKWGIQSNGNMIINAQSLADATRGTNSCNDFFINSINTIGHTDIGLLDYPKTYSGYGYGIGTYLTFGFGRSNSNQYSGKGQIYLDSVGRMAYRYYYNEYTGWSDWKFDNEIVKVRFQCTGSGSPMEGITSRYHLEAGRKYYIKTNIPSTVLSTKRFNVFVEGHSGEYVSCFDCWTTYTPSYSGNLRISNPNSYVGEMVLTVMPDTEECRAIYNTPTEYIVDKTGSRSTNQSLTALILSFTKGIFTGVSNPERDSTALFQDESPKIIRVYPGEYDIFAEYGAAITAGLIDADNAQNYPSTSDPGYSASAFFGKKNAILPPNTTLIGMGDVTLKFKPTAANITDGAAGTWSPLNIKSSCHIKNIKIEVTNCRYGIHDDPGSGKYGDAEHIFEDVYVKYIQGDKGFMNTIGFGFAQNSRYLFKNCKFEYSGNNAHGIFYGHDSGTGEALIVLENCIVKSSNGSETKGIRLQSIQSTSSNPGHNTFKAYNSYLQGGLNFELLTSSDITQQGFETLFLHSGNPSVTITKSAGNTTTNPYTPEVYE